MKRLLIIIGYAIGFYFIVRAILEPIVIDVTDPATYRDDWGGPSLTGVLMVHCGPGVLAAILIIRHLGGFQSRPRRAERVPDEPD